MKRLIIGMFALCIAVLCSASTANAQGYIKLNGLYALGGIVNPQVEFKLTKHSALQTEIVYSPWREFKSGKHFHVGLFSNEYRYYFRDTNDGWYVGAELGIMLFDMSKPTFANGKIGFQNRYCKGYGCLAAGVVGYEWRFAERWMLDAYVGFGYLHSMYNGYSLDGEIQMNPHRPDYKQPKYPDPFNASAEWLPSQIGVSIGFLLWK
jgi:hypothetical protein